MKKVLIGLMCGLVFAVNAETVYVDGKAVDSKIIAQVMTQWKKNPMAAKRLDDPNFKKEMLKTIGMQQAILAEGAAQKLDATSEYQAKLAEMRPIMYAQIMRDRLMAQPITDAQIHAQYDKMKHEASLHQQYNVSHILLKDQKSANDLLAKLKAGAKFADLAKKYSTDPGSKTNGGNLGWSDGSNYVPEFAAAVRQLKAGGMTTSAIKTQFGYHIILLNSIKNGAAEFPGYDKLKERIKQQIQMERTQALFDGISLKHHVEVK